MKVEEIKQALQSALDQLQNVDPSKEVMLIVDQNGHTGDGLWLAGLAFAMEEAQEEGYDHLEMWFSFKTVS